MLHFLKELNEIFENSGSNDFSIKYMKSNLKLNEKELKELNMEYNKEMQIVDPEWEDNKLNNIYFTDFVLLDLLKMDLKYD